MKYDYLIIGQGLAGSVLAYHLLKRNKSIAIIDEQKSSASSMVAAGLVNPLTGPKMIKSWKAELLIPYLNSFYKEVEKVTGIHFFRENTIYRPFASVKDLNDLEGRSSLPNYRKFIKSICEDDKHSNYIQDVYGGVELHGAVLNVSLFIKTLRHYFSSRALIINEHFDERALEFSEREINYKGIYSCKIVFCSGYQIRQSKLFGWVPIAPVKGEILHIKIKEDFKTIYNKSCFIIPQSGGFYKAGSTYKRDDFTEDPSETGKNEISKKLDSLLRMKYEIVKHEAGIRPATISRRPIIGFHPKHNNLCIFNGLGTKGVSLAPYFGNQFVKCLEEGNNLDQEVDIKKDYSLYFNSYFSR